MIDENKTMLEEWVDDILSNVSIGSFWMAGKESLISDEDRESLVHIFDGIDHESFNANARLLIMLIQNYVYGVLKPYMDKKDFPTFERFCADEGLESPNLSRYMLNPRVAERIREFVCEWVVTHEGEFSEDYAFSLDDENTLRKIYEDSLIGEVNDIANMLKDDLQGKLKAMKTEPFSKIQRQLDGFKKAVDRLSDGAKTILHAKAREHGFSIRDEECPGGYLIVNWLSKCLSDPTPLDELFFYTGKSSRQIAISFVALMFFASELELDKARNGDLHEVFSIIIRAADVDYDVHKMTIDAVESMRN